MVRLILTFLTSVILAVMALADDSLASMGGPCGYAGFPAVCAHEGICKPQGTSGNYGMCVPGRLVELGGQCGGVDYTDSQTCVPGAKCDGATCVVDSRIVPPYGMCAAPNWTGGTVCETGTYCAYYNDWESYCLPNGTHW